MDPAFITPFITSIQNVFSTMMQLRVDIGTPAIKKDPAPTYDVSGIIGMSGDVTGSVTLSFPLATAKNVVALFAGAPLEPGTADFADAIGELVNMVSGNAKGQFTGGKKVAISCPSVVVGSNHLVARQKDVPCIAIPCKTDCGDLVIEIVIREVAGTGAVTPSQAAAA
ncbi:MAG: chemotaxis protein CheX [Phycisphaerales bacterium]|nr:chemotaxis protein CheX [Phycisphaerales bacterium]